MQFTETEINQIKKIIEEKGVLCTKDLKAIGISQYRIRKANEEGILIKKSYAHYILNINRKSFKDTNFDSQLNREIKNGNFQVALDILRKESGRQPLKRYYRIILELLENIVTIETTGVLPIPSPCPSRDVYDLIQHRDFIRADRENDVHAKRNSTRGEYTLVGKLLKKIVSYIQEPEEKANRMAKIQTGNESKEKEDTSISTQSDSLVEMLEKLINGEMDESLAIMRRHLKIRGLSEYDYLIEALIRISVATNEMTFLVPMRTLASLTPGKQIDVFEYISDYNTALEANLPIVAQLYLSIIYMAISCGHSNLSMEEVQRHLNTKNMNSTSRPKGHIIKLNEVIK